MTMKLKKRSLLRILGISLSLLLLPGCLSPRHMRAQEIKTDLAIREMKSELEDQKYQMSRLEVEMQIIEGNSDSQITSIHQIRKEMAKLSKNESNLIQNTLAQYEKKLEHLGTFEENLKSDLLLLKDHTKEVVATLAQFKTKIDDNEKSILNQDRYVDHLKSSLESLLKYVDQSNEGTIFYVVQTGDSLERISKENNVSVDMIRELNRLNSDLIIIGQKLRLK